MKRQFSVRTMLWLTLVAAVAFGWWRDHTRLEGIIREKYEENLSLLIDLIVATIDTSKSWGEPDSTTDSP